MNGYGRIYTYWSFGKGKDGKFDPGNERFNQLQRISDGKIENGKLHGFNKVIYPLKNEAYVGFYNQSEIYGKAIYYKDFQFEK